MFSDARRLAAATTLPADICIVGAGVAGISIAREFIGRPERVVLLEGGGLEFTKSLRDLPTVLKRHTLQEQALTGGQNVGQPYYPLRFTRVRAFGGSSRARHTRRGVHARPLDPNPNPRLVVGHRQDDHRDAPGQRLEGRVQPAV